MASELLRPAVVGFLDRIMRGRDQTWRFEEVAVEPGARAVGQMLGSLDILKKVGLPVLALTSPEGVISYYPAADTVLQEQSCLVVLADSARSNACGNWSRTARLST